MRGNQENFKHVYFPASCLYTKIKYPHTKKYKETSKINFSDLFCVTQNIIPSMCIHCKITSEILYTFVLTLLYELFKETEGAFYTWRTSCISDWPHFRPHSHTWAVSAELETTALGTAAEGSASKAWRQGVQVSPRVL